MCWERPPALHHRCSVLHSLFLVGLCRLWILCDCPERYGSDFCFSFYQLFIISTYLEIYRSVFAPCSLFCRIFQSSYRSTSLYLCHAIRLITLGGRSAHLAYHVHKSGRKTPIIIITITNIITMPSISAWSTTLPSRVIHKGFLHRADFTLLLGVYSSIILSFMLLKYSSVSSTSRCLASCSHSLPLSNISLIFAY